MQVCRSGSSGIRSTARNHVSCRGSARVGLSGFQGATGRKSIAEGRRSASRTRSGTESPASASHCSRSSAVDRSDSGGGTDGGGAWCSSPGSGTWNDAIMERIGCPCWMACTRRRSEEHTSELQSPCNLVCRLLLEKKKKTKKTTSQRKKKIQKTNNK